MRAVPRLCELYAGICLTTEEKARKTLTQSIKTSVRVEKFLVRVEKAVRVVMKIIIKFQVLSNFNTFHTVVL